MTTVEIKPEIRVGIDDIPEGVSKLNNHELEQFRKRVNSIWSQRKNKAQQKKENEFQYQWTDDSLLIEGKTPTGRANIQALLMNREGLGKFEKDACEV